MKQGAKLDAAVVFPASEHAAYMVCADLSVVVDIWRDQFRGAI